MNKIIIRKYNKDDANKIRIMTEDAYYKIFSGYSEKWIHSVIPENPLYSGIGSLAVDSVYSGRGYGTRLAAFMTNECIRRGCKNPCIYCETENNNALHIYKKIGYSEQYRESVAFKN